MAVPLRKVANGYPDYEVSPARPTPRVSSKRIYKREVHSKAEYRKAVLFVFSSMAIVLFMMGMSYIFVKAGITKLNWELNQLAGENQSIMMENERLKGMIAGKKSLDRIEAIAIEELGMVKESEVEYMVLSNTVIAEGKIRPVEEEVNAQEEETKPGPIAVIVNFFQAWKK